MNLNTGFSFSDWCFTQDCRFSEAARLNNRNNFITYKIYILSVEGEGQISVMTAVKWGSLNSSLPLDFLLPASPTLRSEDRGFLLAFLPWPLRQTPSGPWGDKRTSIRLFVQGSEGCSLTWNLTSNINPEDYLRTGFRHSLNTRTTYFDKEEELYYCKLRKELLSAITYKHRV